MITRDGAAVITRDEVLAAIDAAERSLCLPFVFVVPVSEQVLYDAGLSAGTVERHLRVSLARSLRELVNSR